MYVGDRERSNEQHACEENTFYKEIESNSVPDFAENALLSIITIFSVYFAFQTVYQIKVVTFMYEMVSLW